MQIDKLLHSTNILNSENEQLIKSINILKINECELKENNDKLIKEIKLAAEIIDKNILINEKTNKDLSITNIKYDNLMKDYDKIVEINKILENKIYNFKSEIENIEINKNNIILEKSKEINDLNNLFIQTTYHHNNKTKELE